MSGIHYNNVTITTFGKNGAMELTKEGNTLHVHHVPSGLMIKCMSGEGAGKDLTILNIDRDTKVCRDLQDNFFIQVDEESFRLTFAKQIDAEAFSEAISYSQRQKGHVSPKQRSGKPSRSHDALPSRPQLRPQPADAARAGAWLNLRIESNKQRQKIEKDRTEAARRLAEEMKKQKECDDDYVDRLFGREQLDLIEEDSRKRKTPSVSFADAVLPSPESRQNNERRRKALYGIRDRGNLRVQEELPAAGGQERSVKSPLVPYAEGSDSGDDDDQVEAFN